MPGELRGRYCDVRQLLDSRLRNHAAVPHKQNPILTITRIFKLQDLATGCSDRLWCDFDDLKQWAQNTPYVLICAGDKAVRLVHGDHHGPKIIRLEHRVTRLEIL